MNKKINSQEIGLDIATSLAKFVTGKENLHYGYWKDLDINLENLGKAQEAYTNKILCLISNERNLKILDIGGGSGETANKLAELGHDVTIVVPSKILAERAQKNTKGKVKIEVTSFELYKKDIKNDFDLCLFSESFQYIPIDYSLKKSKEVLKNNGKILIADCFRSKNYNIQKNRPPGGGHSISLFYKKINELGLNIIYSEDITIEVSYSVDLEQKFYNTLGFIFQRIQKEIKLKRPIIYKIMLSLFKLFINRKRRKKLFDRLYKNERSSETFNKNNNYMIFLLENKN